MRVSLEGHADPVHQLAAEAGAGGEDELGHEADLGSVGDSGVARLRSRWGIRHTRRMNTPRTAACIFLLALVSACSGEGTEGECADGMRFIRFASPVEAQVLTADDDVEPGGVVDYDVVVEHCGFTADDEIGIYLLEPVASPYGFRWVTADQLVYRVPFVPGEQRMQARTRDDAVQSEVLSFSVVP